MFSIVGVKDGILYYSIMVITTASAKRTETALVVGVVVPVVAHYAAMRAAGIILALALALVAGRAVGAETPHRK